jgi:hypothetical protein
MKMINLDLLGGEKIDVNVEHISLILESREQASNQNTAILYTSILLSNGIQYTVQQTADTIKFRIKD